MNGKPVFVRDALHDREPNAGSLCTRGEERIEEPFLRDLVQTDTIVLNRLPHVVRRLVDREFYLHFVFGTTGLDCVAHQVPGELAELSSICAHQRRLRRSK